MVLIISLPFRRIADFILSDKDAFWEIATGIDGVSNSAVSS
jgi:hypothetical protein